MIATGSAMTMFALLLFAGFSQSVWSEHVQTVTVYPMFHSLYGRMTFDPERWNGHHGFDKEELMPLYKSIGTRAGRWAHPDVSDTFTKAPEDPHRKGYADPNYFKNHHVQEALAKTFKANLDGYGSKLGIMMYTMGTYWPKYMGTSKYQGKLPDNVDTGVDMLAMMFEAVSNYTGGRVPSVYEPMNEPGGLYKYMTYSDVYDFYKRVGKKLKPRWPQMLVGGPAWTGGVKYLHERDYRTWKFLEQFLNMSLGNLDFFSFHAFDHYNLLTNTTHRWGELDEAKLVGIFDIVESFAQQKSNKFVPIFITEWGVSGPKEWYKRQPGTVSEWTFGYNHNAMLFTFLNSRGFVDRGDAFLSSNPYFPEFTYAREFYANKTVTGVGKAYQFWHHFTSGHKFVRAKSSFDNSVRMVTPLVLADPHRQHVIVLLHNHAQTTSKVRIDFHENWTEKHGMFSTCYQLSHNNAAVLHNGGLSMVSGVVALPPESSCFLTFPTKYHLSAMKVSTEEVQYGSHMLIPIRTNVVNTAIHLNHSQLTMVQYASLRIVVSGSVPNVTLTPTTVNVNGHELRSFFSLMKPSNIQSNSDFDVIEYEVAVALLRTNSNSLRLHFSHSHGYVASVAFVMGKTVEHPSTIIG